jgi:hypothetical protein
MPSLLTLFVWAVHSATGNALWVRFDEPPEVSAIALLPFLLLLGNWSLVLLAIVTWNSRKGGMNPRVALVSNLGALLFLLPANLILWYATPDENFSSHYDAGQGTGLFISLLIFVSPLLASVGWTIGRGIAFIAYERGQGAAPK